jgi:hypothetical protein
MDRKRANKIGPGDLFKKKDTGIIIEIVSRANSSAYMTRRVNKNMGAKSSHKIMTHDLLKHYIRI